MSITYYDNLSQWNPQQLCCPGRIRTVSNSPGPYYGSNLIEIECRNLDRGTGGDAAATRSRIEMVLHPAGAVDGNTEWYAWSMVSVSGTISTTDWFFRHQWHATNGPDKSQAMIIINNRGNGLNIRTYDAATKAQSNFLAKNSSGADLTWTHGVAYHLVQKIKWSKVSGQGRLEMWCNGVKFVDKAMTNIYNTTPFKANVKMGMYCDDGTISSPVICRYDGFRIGTANETLATMSADFPPGSGYEGSGSGGGGGGGGDPATLEILTPSNGATLTGRADWLASATDPNGIANVAFKVDGTTVLTETNPPYGDTVGHWDSTTVADGAHTLAVTSTNGVGGTLSKSISVTVDNTVDPPPPDPDPPQDVIYHKVTATKIAPAKGSPTKISTDGKVTYEEQVDESNDPGGGGGETFGTSAILLSGTQADALPPNGSWTTGINSSHGGIEVVSNKIKGDTSADNSMYYNASTFGANCETYITVNTKGADGSRFYLWLRGADFGTTGPDGYIMRCDLVSSGADTMKLFKVTNGSETQIGSTFADELVTGDALGIKAFGSTISAWKKVSGGSWVKVIETTDATYGSAGRIGLYCRAGIWRFTNLGGGTLT